MRLDWIFLWLLGLAMLAVESAGKKDHYQILSVPRNADDKQIKKAYRKLAMKWHPDKHQEPASKAKAEKNFMRIAKAYETLSDPELRRVYDQVGEEGVKNHEQQQPHQGHQRHQFQGEFDPFVLFEQMFGGGGGGRGGGGGNNRRGGNRGPSQPGQGMFDNTPVRIANDDNAKLVLGKHIRRDVFVILFYAPWCGHCQQIKPEFIAFAKQAHGLYQVVAVDCDTSSKLCAHYKIQGFPTIIGLLPEESRTIVFSNSKRDKQSLIQFANELLPTSLVRIVQNEHEVDCQSKFCIVILSNKSVLSPLVKALSLRFKGKATVYQVVIKKQRDTVRFGQANTPLPALFVNGNLQYTGKLQLQAVEDYVLTVMARKQQRDEM
ncbi:hypothetical protein BASA81_001959 [Batrachochytrium salamandrivorans]|nr:hypothetical protein BASA81_001959 [Batrachochytrium salamandrivorans]